MGVNKVLSTGLLVAVVAVSVGCEEFENKPKDPLVEGVPSRFNGSQNGVELNPEEGLATYYLSSVNASSRFAFFDYLSDKVDDEMPVVRSGEFRPDREFGWFSERNRALTHFGGYDIDGLNWFMVNTSAETLYFQIQGHDPAVSETDFADLAALDGEFNCLQYNVLPAKEVREFDLGVTQGSAVFTDKTPAAFGASQQLTLTKGEWAKLLVAGGNGGFSQVCAGKEPEGFQDDFYDYLKANYTNTDTYYDICWTVDAQGGFQLDGNALFFTHLALVEPVRKRFFDANNDGKEDTTGADMPEGFIDNHPNDPEGPPGPDGLGDGTVPLVPLDISRLATPNSEGLAGINGFRPVRSTNYCLRKGDGVSAQNLSGTFWVGQMLQDSGDSFVVFSGVGFDGNSLAAEEQIKSSRVGNLRELGYDYFVESNGEITVNGGKGFMSADGRLIMYDMSNAALNRIGMAVGIKEASLQNAKAEN